MVRFEGVLWFQALRSRWRTLARRDVKAPVTLASMALSTNPPRRRNKRNLGRSCHHRK